MDARTVYALKETFGYDNLYRLNSWSIAQGTTTNSYSLNYKTDNSGNMDTKTGIGTFNFNMTGKPHRVSGVLLSSPSDLPTTLQTINYTDFGKVSDITENNYNLTFTYGPDQERVTGVMKQGGSTQYTMYYGGMYEKKVMAAGTTTQYIYIPGGDGMTAVYVKPAGPGSLYYMHKDHLGSITTVTNTSGAIVEQYAYDPWGRRRNPSDWSFTNVTAPTLLTRGFTGHEHINELNLINMNGRMYDPLLGMFLSPDIFVQAPSSSQSYNRYSYCMGNPLMYTDPSGNTWLSQAWSWIKEHKEDILISTQDPTYLLGRLDTEKHWSEKQALYYSFNNILFFDIPYKIYNSLSDNPHYNIELDNHLNGRPNINGNDEWMVNKNSEGDNAAYCGPFFMGYYGSIGLVMILRSKFTYSGNYYDATVYTTNELQQGAACTLPGIGIFVNPKDVGDADLLAHEYGHILQAKKWGYGFFYSTVAPASVSAARYANAHSNYTPLDYMSNWTEWSANYLSYQSYSRNFNTKDYPISPVNIGPGIETFPSFVKTPYEFYTKWLF